MLWSTIRDMANPLMMMHCCLVRFIGLYYCEYHFEIRCKTIIRRLMLLK